MPGSYWDGDNWIESVVDAGDMKYHDGANWIDVPEGYYFDPANGWTKFFPGDLPEPPDPIPPGGGTYVLTAYSTVISGVAGGSSYAEFATSLYRGKITAAKARISWTSLGSMSSNVYGRTSNTYYRALSYDPQYAYRTIDHDLGSTAVSQLNSGAAVGYNIYPTTSYTPNQWMSRLQLVLTTSG